MDILDRLDKAHSQARQNLWLYYFSVFNRIVLAAGFIPAGITKVIGERFASGLSVVHPMGHYLEALHFTAYYYTFIGIAQIAAGILLLIPRSVTLGALIYFPIILNICILSFAVRFDGSLLTAPLMVLANLYLLAWNYDKLKFILPVKNYPFQQGHKETSAYQKEFPFKYFIAFAATVVIVIAAVVTFNMYAVMPRNSLKDCVKQFEGTHDAEAGNAFCQCIHTDGNPLNECLEEYETALGN
ncbi:putative membrane protein YphA (DoxX/SURF4 family) [Catalinimonas alkaloidigena]|uniref:DoxX family protein n=1 Tax=Catalinimonas alkaloidigena TaxID=1075417 RepID=UPI00240593FA|nr:DoxX family protein [Catalinimonas alkaloidigena]MDF9799384.1 putative membrane protein YphA (DoxX/SURF4 family) [Catalinimonas alkaloidigena]